MPCSPTRATMPTPFAPTLLNGRSRPSFPVDQTGQSSASTRRLSEETLMQLIGMPDSPYVRRVAIALITAKTPFIHRPISLFRHIDQFSELNPLLKAPTLITDDGAALMDSSVILDYLGGLSPGIASLTPSKDAP